MSLDDLFLPFLFFVGHGCIRACNYYKINSNILNINNKAILSILTTRATFLNDKKNFRVET